MKIRNKYLKKIITAQLISLIFLTNFVYAQTVDELKSSVSSLSEKISNLDKEIKEFNKKISNTQGEATSLKKALASLENQRSLLNKEIDLTNLKIISANDEIIETSGKLQNTALIIQNNEDALKEVFKNIHQNETSNSLVLNLLNTKNSLSDSIEFIKRGEELTNDVSQKVIKLKDAKNKLALEKQNFEHQKKNLESLSFSLNDKKLLVENNSSEKSRLLVATKNKESEYQKLLADRKAKRKALESEMLSVESKLKTVVDASKIPSKGSGTLKWPFDKVIITQYFGNTPFASKNSQVYNGNGHNGIDFGAPTGTPTLSAQSGTVVGTGNTDDACYGVSYGKWVLIRHNNGLTTLYAHLSKIEVQNGQLVTSGERIGLSGNTGYSTGPHLHFTVYASDAVQITDYVSKVCGTIMTMPIAPKSGYLNPLTFL